VYRSGIGPKNEDTMAPYIIRGDTVTAYASAPAGVSENELPVRSAKEIEGSRLSVPRWRAQRRWIIAARCC